MFGDLTAAVEELDESQLERDRECFCGLCRSLRGRYGQAAGLTLNYDMTFLVLLLNSLYEPEETTGEDSCARHPVKPRRWSRSDVTDYAADMNIALAYLKCVDDWKDEGSLKALSASGLLRRDYERVCALYPRQCEAMEKSLAALHDIEKQNLDSPDEAAACFGDLMAEIFLYKEDRWSGALGAMAHALGRFIYLMDACMDLDADTIRNNYNPLRRYYGLENEQRFRDILKMQMGECVYWFDYLPLVRDSGLMKNILCSGLWVQFNRKYGRKDNTGPLSSDA